MLTNKLTGAGAADKTYIEDVFSTYLYTGNGSTQTINNGIQLGDGYSAGTTGGRGYFNGSARLNFSDITLSGQFTMETWVYNTGSNSPQIASYGGKSYTNNTQFLRILNGKQYYTDATAGNAGVEITGTVNVPSNQWVHLAITRDASNVVRIFTNGVLAGSATDTATLYCNQISGIFYNGSYYDLLTGYLSNFRLVTGSALYTSNFTVPSSELTAVSGTQLLCLQGATPFVDNSGNSRTITNTSATSSSTGPFPYMLVAGKGGMVWVKTRNQAGFTHGLFDTARGVKKSLSTDSSSGEATENGGVTSFNSNGFAVGSWSVVNYDTSTNYASWTFRKAPKFFDVVTYTGNGVAGRQISHSLGQAPGMMIIKCTNNSASWAVYHRGVNGGTNPQNFFMFLNDTMGQAANSSVWNNTAPTDTNFTVGAANITNQSGNTYVAYLFAHDTTTDGLIQCGSVTTSGSSFSSVNLGWEPQFVLVKSSNYADGWKLLDTSRGLSFSTAQLLQPNDSAPEIAAGANYADVNATGFRLNGAVFGSNTYIYMAIRRGPMRTPTDGTKVFAPVTYSGNSSNQSITTNFVVDMEMVGCRQGGQGWEQAVVDRLRGNGRKLSTASTAAEEDWSSYLTTEFQSNTGTNRTGPYLNFSSLTYVDWAFKRAPGFFDVVCYTGTGSARTVNHNLGVAPELMIVKRRDFQSNWNIYSASAGNNSVLFLDDTTGKLTPDSTWNNTSPTSSVFSVGSGATNLSGGTYVAYLFASCPGVSKVGSYTGTGSDLNINCGFTNGARFVLIKRTDSSGSWFVFDTARGITSGNDPYLLLNSTSAEGTFFDLVDPYSLGFTVTGSDPAVNASGGTYLYLAIA